MNILDRIRQTAALHPERTAIQSGGESMCYGELWEKSGRLASWLLKKDGGEGGNKLPAAVYGHKSPWMLVCFLGLVRSGRGYCPIDLSVPASRVHDILEALPSDFVFSVEEPPEELARGIKKEFLTMERLTAVLSEGEADPDECEEVKGEDLFYLIFTSGSTGVPKGVQVTADCLNHFLDWSESFIPEEGLVFLNQAPFSFDLSVMDLYTCLATGGTLYCLKKETQQNYKDLLAALGESGASVWVSTPSFADVCLADPAFGHKLLDRMKVFLFCGETLRNKTAGKLLESFPGARVYNTYGPTESTVAVTGIEVTKELAEQPSPLPVGRAKPGTLIQIRDEEGGILEYGKEGEIVILGDTVSPGYYGRPDLTGKAFFMERTEGKELRAYHTGDKGYLQDDCLYYGGRIDLQIKLHGYRIEPEDIESNLSRLPMVEKAVVLPNERGGKVSSLTAYVKVPGLKPEDPDSADMAGRIRQELGKLIPEYMIPKKIVFIENIPMTSNGKADRKSLAAMSAAAGRRGAST